MLLEKRENIVKCGFGTETETRDVTVCDCM